AVTTARDGNRLGDGNAFLIGRFDSLTLRSSSTEADLLTFTLGRVGLCASRDGRYPTGLRPLKSHDAFSGRHDWERVRRKPTCACPRHEGCPHLRRQRSET